MAMYFSFAVTNAYSCHVTERGWLKVQSGDHGGFSGVNVDASHTSIQRQSSPGEMSDINEHIQCEKIFYLSSNKAETKGCLVCILQSLHH